MTAREILPDSPTPEPSQNHAKTRKHKKLIVVLVVLLILVIVGVAAYFVVLKVGEIKLRNKLKGDDAKLPAIGTDSIPEDADAFYNGEAYHYNDELINILLIGVDRTSDQVTNSHQADALYLFSLDTTTHHVNILAISRNTITQVDVYDINNRYLSTDKEQICLAYTYGKDARQSSDLTVKAVSNLLYGVPIGGYYTVYMDAVEQIINAVGGVPVTIDEDMTTVSAAMRKGAKVVVTGEKALPYLRFRHESNQPRLERQKTFLLSFITQAKAATQKDLSLPVKIYKEVASKTVTDVNATSAAYLASEALNADVQLRSIQGTAGFDGFYETFKVDEDQLYLLLLDVFYKKQ